MLCTRLIRSAAVAAAVVFYGHADPTQEKLMLRRSKAGSKVDLEERTSITSSPSKLQRSPSFGLHHEVRRLEDDLKKNNPLLENDVHNLLEGIEHAKSGDATKLAIAEDIKKYNEQDHKGHEKHDLQNLISSIFGEDKNNFFKNLGLEGDKDVFKGMNDLFVKEDTGAGNGEESTADSEEDGAEGSDENPKRKKDLQLHDMLEKLGMKGDWMTKMEKQLGMGEGFFKNMQENMKKPLDHEDHPMNMFKNSNLFGEGNNGGKWFEDLFSGGKPLGQMMNGLFTQATSTSKAEEKALDEVVQDDL